MSLPRLLDVLRGLPYWLVQVAWVLLLVASFAALAYVLWYLVERRERARKAVRGFGVGRDDRKKR